MSITNPSLNNNTVLGSQTITATTQWDPHTGGCPNNGISGLSITPLTIGSLGESISGEMLLVERIFESDETIPDKETIKKELVQELVEKILKNNFVEFTMQEDFKTNIITYRARAYLTPDSQVRTLRKELI